jgi:hypothetical protein
MEQGIEMNSANKPTSNRAVAALNSLLSQVSAITLKDIGLDWPVPGSDLPNHEIDILAHVEIFGRNHTLACQIIGGDSSSYVCAALEELRASIAHLPGEVTPILILPVLTPEVQMQCAQCHAGCLDLRGNGRLTIGEVFISMRSLPRRPLHRPVPALRTAIATAGEANAPQALPRGFPPVPTGLPHGSTRVAGQGIPH